MRANITDECGLVLTDNIVNFSVSRDSTTNYCNPIINEGDGNYNCSLNTSTYSAKGWNVIFNSSRQYYNSRNLTEAFQIWQRGFWVETKPVLTTNFSYNSFDYQGNLGDGGWGETWKFYVNATDEDGDTLDVRLWVNTSASPEIWQQKGVNNSVNGTNTTMTFTLSPVFGPSEASKPRKFKFNVSEVQDIFGNTTKDFVQNLNNTINSTFTTQKDDINFTWIEGNDTVVNRSLGSQHLKVRVYDTDTGTVAYQTLTSPPSARVWVTTNYSYYPQNYTIVPLSTPTTQITQGGYINTTGSGFDPNCLFAIGPQRWKVGTTDDNSYYKAANSTEYYITIVTSPLAYNIKEPISGEKFRKNPPNLIDDILIRLNVTDDCGLIAADDVNIYAERGSIVKECLSPDGAGDYNCTIPNTTIDSDPTWEYGYWNLSVNATKANYNSSMTSTYLRSQNFPYQECISIHNLIHTIGETFGHSSLMLKTRIIQEKIPVSPMFHSGSIPQQVKHTRVPRYV